MKKITCYDCDTIFHSETSDDVLNQLYTHYMKEHNEIITSVNKEEKKAWMERFRKDWANAEEA